VAGSATAVIDQFQMEK